MQLYQLYQIDYKSELKITLNSLKKYEKKYII
jgi:hypothetical protein